MLILLPPSEGKTAPAAGAPLDLGSLVLPALAGERATVMGILAAVSAAPDAPAVLGISERLRADIEANTVLDSAPAAPAHRVFTGVLFDALDYASLPETARRRAREDVLVFSGLFGVLSLGDRIPHHRLSVGATLPGTGRMSSWWKPRLTPLLDARAEHAGVVVDCRSGGYAAQWRAPADRTVTVDVFQVREGRRTVVSHFAKHTRGLVARQLLLAGPRAVHSPAAAAEVVAAAGAAAGPHDWTVDLLPAAGSKPGRLEVTLPEQHSTV
ncbi:peroxide stress protein YaaA [Citricoccus sp. SGAir0253]|uniref:YaaA family protein n=1 Tax=Citricoccus sp. SGAir0253 TaxID=2567881 RepID=UPI0010CCF331|nr:peroxide stress protein YaaA [Citricoccus sp. SGAir0253]QCU78313.1 peroxide stress protein YaaA [Citricoccus sp. SGAir0253]